MEKRLIIATLLFCACLCFADDLTQGLEAYRQKDYVSALFFLKKAIAIGEHKNHENMYMLIMAEIASGEAQSAANDCEDFMHDFPKSIYFPYIQYQYGRLLHFAGFYDKSILTLSDFCHNFPDNEMYASGLYWMAESFYNDYDFSTAESLYERVVSDFPSDEKVPLCQKRLEDIAARQREAKLLYLLKLTGEEYLSAKEEYERQLRLYMATDSNTLREQALKLAQELEEQKRLNAELEKKLSESNNAPKKLQDEEVMRLKRKAAALQVIIDEGKM